MFFLDNSAWLWDQALYGERTIDLYKSLRRDSFVQYINLFFNIMGSKAPANLLGRSVFCSIF